MCLAKDITYDIYSTIAIARTVAENASIIKTQIKSLWDATVFIMCADINQDACCK